MTSAICRLCLCEGQLVSLFHRIQGMTLGDKIMAFTSLHIKTDDQLPSQICNKCVGRVNDSYEFKILCEDSDSILRKRLNDNKPSLDSNVSIKNEQDSDVDADCLPVEFQVKYDNSDNEKNRINDNGENSSEDVLRSKRANKRRHEERDRTDEDSYSDDTNSDEMPLSKSSNLVRKRNKSDNSKKKYVRSKKRKGSDSRQKPEKGSWRWKSECPTCGKVLANKYGLGLHMRIHTGEKFKCNHCERSFTMYQTLRAHERAHTGEIPLLCSVCGKSFSTTSNLITHRKIHTGEKPHKCTLCPSAFNRRGHLEFHMKIHMGEKSYKCHLCEKAFVTKDYLKSHLKSHSGERNFVCNVCGKRMTRSHHLKLHMMTHTGDRPYKCEICDLSFIQKGYWMKHMNRHKANDSIKQCSKEKIEDIKLDNNIPPTNIF